MSPPLHPRHRLRQRVTLLAVVTALAVLVAASDPIFRLFERLVLALQPVMESHPTAGAAAFTVLAALSALLAFFSSTLLVPIAIEAWGEGVTIALLWIGWMIGGVLAYSLGRWVGRPIARSLAGPERLAYYESRIGEQTPFGLVLLLHLALQSEIPGLVLGLVRYAPARFLLALGLAEIPYALGTVYLGHFFLQRRALPLLLGALVAVGVAIWAFRLLHRTLEEDG